MPSHLNSGFYDNTDSLINEGISCEECVVGTACDHPGIELTLLPVRLGYYRMHPTSIDVRKCPDAQYSSGCLGGTDVETQCNDVLSGLFCQLCPEPTENKTYYYSAATTKESASCELCTDTMQRFAIGTGIALASILVAIWLLSTCWFKVARDDHRRRISSAVGAFGLKPKFKILVGFCSSAGFDISYISEHLWRSTQNAAPFLPIPR